MGRVGDSPFLILNLNLNLNLPGTLLRNFTFDNDWCLNKSMSFLLNWFFPRHTNNHKASLIKSYSLFLISFVFVLLQVFLNFCLLAKPAVLGFSSNITPEMIIEMTNAERIKLNLPSLKENKLLSEAARQKAADMFAFNYWSHVSPSGRSPWAFFTEVGYKYQYAGENLARDFHDPEAVIRAWMNSLSHKENIVNPKYQEIGVVVVEGTLQGVETALVVQLFGTPYGGVAPVAEKPKPGPAKETVEEKIPARKERPLVVSQEVLSKGQDQQVPVTNPLDLTKAMVIFIVGILIGIFAVDVFLVSYRQTPRLSSRSFAQMMFLIFVLVVSLLIKEGAIL